MDDFDWSARQLRLRTELFVFACLTLGVAKFGGTVNIGSIFPITFNGFDRNHLMAFLSAVDVYLFTHLAARTIEERRRRDKHAANLRSMTETLQKLENNVRVALESLRVFKPGQQLRLWRNNSQPLRIHPQTIQTAISHLRDAVGYQLEANLQRSNELWHQVDTFQSDVLQPLSLEPITFELLTKKNAESRWKHFAYTLVTDENEDGPAPLDVEALVVAIKEMAQVIPALISSTKKALKWHQFERMYLALYLPAGVAGLFVLISMGEILGAWLTVSSEFFNQVQSWAGFDFQLSDSSINDTPTASGTVPIFFYHQ